MRDIIFQKAAATVAVFFCFCLAPRLSGACSCVISQSICQEVANSNLVFIGTVDSIEPGLLDRWNLSAQRNWMHDPEIARLKKDPSEQGLRNLKEKYSKLFFDLPGAEKVHLQAARTQNELQNVITGILTQGTRVRFKVKTIFQQQEDDGSDRKGDQKDKPKIESINIWNEAGDCSIAFQKGETYIVYATDDEDSNRFTTSVCHRTARLSDAGEDLAYLDFFHRGGAPATRLEGFVTSDVEQLNQDRFHYSATIPSPVPGMVIELKSSGGSRYTSTDPGGRFVFDGLAAGDYQVSVFDTGFPEIIELLNGPKRLHATARGCAAMNFLVVTRGRRD